MGIRAGALLVVIAVGGCSFLILDTLPRHPDPDDEPRCDTGKFAPIVDTISAIVDVTAVGAIGFDTGQSQAIAAVIGLAIDLTSAMYGFSETSRCSEAIDRWHRHHKAKQKADDLREEKRDDELRELRRVQDAQQQKDRDDLDRLRREDAERRERENPPMAPFVTHDEDGNPIDAGVPAVDGNQESN